MKPEELQDPIAESQRLYDLAGRRPAPGEWLPEIGAARVSTLIALLSRLGYPDQTHTRESVKAAIEEKLAERVIAATTRVERVGGVLAAVGALLAAVQVWQGFR